MSKKENDKKIWMAKAWVEVYHRNNFRTAIIGHELYPSYYIVTRVNYLTAGLWLEWRNKKVNDGRKHFIVLPNKANLHWLIMVGNFRRKQDRMIKVMEYLEERKKRTINQNKQ